MSSAAKTPLVCHFLIDYRIGGPHKYVEVCAKYMNKEYESLLFTCGKSKIKSIPLVNLRTIHRYLYPIEVLINMFYIILIVCYYYLFRRSVIFNIHGIHNLAPILAGSILRIPSVLLIHESMRELKIFARVALFFLCLNYGKVLSVSKNALNKYDIENGEVVFSPVNMGYWEAGSRAGRNSISELRETDQKIRLLFVGNLNPIKGLDRLLDALGHIPRPISFYIIGAPVSSHSAYFNDLIKKAKAAENKNTLLKIKFLDWQEVANIRRFLYSAEILLMPSSSEGCPIALIEAMATGCIPFVTDVGDLKQILSPILSETVCEGFDSEALYQGLMQLLCKLESLSPKEESKLRLKLVSVVRKNFDVSIVARKIINAYKAVEERSDCHSSDGHEC